MTFGDSIKTCLSKYVTWRGRASRSEYWWFQLIYAPIAYLFVSSLRPGAAVTVGMLIIFLLWLSLLLPFIAVSVRRLHDMNHTGWWYWIALIPLIGGIIFLGWFCFKGTEGLNSYGEDPLTEVLTDVFR